jgi:uncharacterized protein with LGFP repeats
MRNENSHLAADLILGRESTTSCSGAEAPSTWASAMYARYLMMGKMRGILCPAPSAVPQTTDRDGYDETYAGGTIYWTRPTDAQKVHGLLSAKYEAIDGASGVGYPTTDDISGNNRADIRDSKSQRGSISWNISAGAHGIDGGHQE